MLGVGRGLLPPPPGAFSRDTAAPCGRPSTTGVKQSLRESKASFHQACFTCLSDIIHAFFLKRYALYFYWLFRKEINQTSSRP